MIQLEQPSMAFNSHDTWSQVRMWNTRRVEARVTPQEIVEAGETVAASTPDQRLKNVVFSCHGEPGRLRIGTGLQLADLDPFSRWQGKVGAIWMHACLVGRSAQIGLSMGQDDGAVFCSSLARVSGCRVVASADIQAVSDFSQAFLPIGQLDQFEGRVTVWGPDGRVLTTKTLPYATHIRSTRYTGNPG